ncbi:PerC family transcriptional regulator [Escherichia coli]|nr:PerC family transcriptional regulator [Escherichia coli]
MVAQRLEAAGHWRRASARWLSVMGLSEHTEAQWEWLLRRREYCLAQILPPARSDKLDVAEVARAANATLKRMGIGICHERWESDISATRVEENS